VNSYSHFRFQFHSLWIASRRFHRIRKRVGFLCSGSVRILAAFLRLRLLSRRGRFRRSHPVNGTRLKLILLSYERPANVDLLVRLCCIDPVDRIVVSNNNPRYRVRDIVRVRDPRLLLIDQEDHVKPGIRFVLARDEPSDLYIAIDDDVFLTPSQLGLLAEKAATQPESPHGLIGKVLRGKSFPPWPFVPADPHDRARVHILNCVYAFTREHLDEYFRLAESVGIEDHAQFANGEDIILSFSGRERPQIHDFGPVTMCASSALAGIAISTTHHHFYKERWELFSSLSAIKPFERTCNNTRTGTI
jgi:hypothetical protein